MPKLFHDSAAVPLGAFYIARQIDTTYLAELRESFATGGIGPHLHGSRQSGKTSLLIRTKAALRADYTVLLVDLQSRFSGYREVDESAPGALSFPEFWERIFQSGIGTALQRVAEEEPENQGMIAGALAAIPRETAGFAEPVTVFEALIAALVPRPLMLLVDEFDRIGDSYRNEFSRVLRVLHGRRADYPSGTFNVSLVGVLPPVRQKDSPDAHRGIENVGGRAIWLDDFPVTDAIAAQLQGRFQARPATQAFRVEDGRALLTYTGGYPQAVSWAGNEVMAAAEQSRIRFDDASFGARLREICAEALRDDAATTASTTDENPTTWLETLADYFTGHTDARHLNATADALRLYREVLERELDPVLPRIEYQPHSEAHQTLRYSGIGRRDRDGRLRLRAVMFLDAFGLSWVDRLRKEVYRKQSAAYARLRRPSRPGTSQYASDKRLLILSTGGTIGMAETTGGSIGLEEDLLPEWAFEVKELLGELPTVQPLFGLDGADVGPQHWTDLARYILRNQSDFDALVVTHGTDTLAYSASALAFALGKDLGFPVVFTGSQTTSDVLHGDSISNILRACLVATQDLPEVVVCFGEKIFRATRTQKKDDLRFDAFESPGYPELGFVAEEVQVFRQSLLTKGTVAGALTQRPTEFHVGILHISQMPGSEAAFYEAAMRILVDGERKRSGERSLSRHHHPIARCRQHPHQGSGLQPRAAHRRGQRPVDPGDPHEPVSGAARQLPAVLALCRGDRSRCDPDRKHDDLGGRREAQLGPAAGRGGHRGGDPAARAEARPRQGNDGRGVRRRGRVHGVQQDTDGSTQMAEVRAMGVQRRCPQRSRGPQRSWPIEASGHPRRKPPARSCRDAAHKRVRLGETSIPLWDELKSFFAVFEREGGGSQSLMVHCRGDRVIDLDRVADQVGGRPERLRGEAVERFGMEYGLVNPFEPSAMDGQLLTSPVLQLFDRDLLEPIGTPGTVMTNAGDLAWWSSCTLGSSSTGSTTRSSPISPTTTPATAPSSMGRRAGNHRAHHRQRPRVGDDAMADDQRRGAQRARGRCPRRCGHATRDRPVAARARADHGARPAPQGGMASTP